MSVDIPHIIILTGNKIVTTRSMLILIFVYGVWVLFMIHYLFWNLYVNSSVDEIIYGHVCLNRTSWSTVILLKTILIATYIPPSAFFYSESRFYLSLPPTRQDLTQGQWPEDQLKMGIRGRKGRTPAEARTLLVFASHQLLLSAMWVWWTLLDMDSNRHGGLIIA